MVSPLQQQARTARPAATSVPLPRWRCHGGQSAVRALRWAVPACRRHRVTHTLSSEYACLLKIYQEDDNNLVGWSATCLLSDDEFLSRNQC
uniref:Uncharacterized protein n=1 Tax=Oryza nivara TaxID=4536 RepID=A0A0E0GQ96_ORYNI